MNKLPWLILVDLKQLKCGLLKTVHKGPVSRVSSLKPQVEKRGSVKERVNPASTPPSVEKVPPQTHHNHFSTPVDPASGQFEDDTHFALRGADYSSLFHFRLKWRPV